MLGQLQRTYRYGMCLLLALVLAACSTAPMRMSGNPQPYAGTEPRAPRTMPPGLPQFIDHSVGEEEISIQAMSLVGVPYRWGGNTPDSGFDCSGLVTYVVRRAAAVNLPRTTEQMESVGTPINPDEISPGDLIFFNTTGRAHSHVGIYVGQYRFVNAPSTGGTVRIDYVTNPYWAKRFDGIRRVASGAPHNRPFETAPLEAAAAPASAMTAALQTGSSLNAKSRADAVRSSSKPQPETDPTTQTEADSRRPTPDTESPGPDNQAYSPAVLPPPAPTGMQSGTATDTQPDPIAEIANLSGAGSIAPTPASHPTVATPPAPQPSAAPANTPAADPIAGFANSSL